VILFYQQKVCQEKRKAFKLPQNLYKMLANDIAGGPLLCCKTDADSSAVLEQAKQIGFDIDQFIWRSDHQTKEAKLSLHYGIARISKDLSGP